MKKIGLITIIGAIFIFTTCSPHIHLDFMGKEQIQEVVLIKKAVPEKILVIDINGPIVIRHTSAPLNRNGDLLSKIYLRLYKAAEDKNIKGIILRLDTPGGEGTASDIIYNEISRFKKKTGIPVIALMMNMAASGGYYVACACDYILAHPTTITGSIGVIAVLPQVNRALAKLGVDIHIIKSAKMKDAGSPLKEINAEEKAVFQEMVDELHQRFLDIIHLNRGKMLTRKRISELADGRIYRASRALELKLIDKIGYFDTAYNKILELASLKEAKVIAYSYYPSRKTNIYANSLQQDNPLSLKIKTLDNLLPKLKTGFYYLWLPGEK